MARGDDFPTLEFEQELWQVGFQWIAGIDEAGRGALAGPVVAAMVILPDQPSLLEKLSGVRDSKMMTASQREHWREIIKKQAHAWGIGEASASEIDQLGIVPATRLAAARALEHNCLLADYLLTDYLELPDIALPQLSLVKGDCRSLSIAAASVLAKTHRDDLMRAYHDQYPGYGWRQNKGYGTQAHRAAIKRLGACAIHRGSFKIAE